MSTPDNNQDPATESAFEQPVSPEVPVRQVAVAPSEPQPVDEPAAPAVPEGKPNFQQDYDYSTKDYPNFVVGAETALMPGATASVTKASLDNLPQAQLGKDPDTQDWINLINGGLASIPYGDGLAPTAVRYSAAWRQAVTSAVGPLGGWQPKMKSGGDKKLTGDQARWRIRSALGMGTVFAVPLWHSGFWITLKSPSEQALLELFRQITAEKISLGRSTYGFLYSNGTSYTSRLLLDFAMDHMYDHSVNLDGKTNVRDLIRTPDLSVLIWGLACAIYPNGFQYQRACVADPEKCKHVLSEKLNLSKLLWTDTSELTERQISHMAKKGRNSHTVEDVKRYVSDFVRGQDAKVDLTDNLSMILKLPTVVEHVDAGYRWINALEEMYARTLTQDLEARDNYLINQGKATVLRQYTHFVKSIILDGGEEVFTDRDTIEDTLNDLTARDDIRDLFEAKAREFLDNSIISMVAIPTFKCPACGNEHPADSDRPRHPELIGLDVTQTFFQLLVQKLRMIEAR